MRNMKNITNIRQYMRGEVRPTMLVPLMHLGPPSCHWDIWNYHQE